MRPFAHRRNASSISGKSLASLHDLARSPPERLHRFSDSSEEAITFYIFRVPGRHELCLSTTKPGGDAITDVDVAASFYLLRFDEESSTYPTNVMTLLRLDPSSGVMGEAAIMIDPPGRVEVFEDGYTKIESNYWSMKSQASDTVISGFECLLATSQSSLTFTTPWVGTADLMSSKLGNALKCYHTIPHVEGDHTNPKVQVSELRFNFHMPRMSTSGQVTSKRTSIALQVRNSPALEHLNTRRRMLLGSSADTTDSLSNTIPAVERDTLSSKDHEFTHPSFYVPQTQGWRVPARQRATSDLTGYTMTGSAAKLVRVSEDQPGPPADLEASTKPHSREDGQIDRHGVTRSLPHEAGLNQVGNSAEPAPSTPLPTRIMGPRPLPPPGTKTSVLGEDVETGTVKTGTPTAATSHVDILPLRVEPELVVVSDTNSVSKTAQQGTLPPRHSSRPAHQHLSNLSTLSLASSRDTSPEKLTAGGSVVREIGHSKASSIRRKPLRSGTSDSNSPVTPASGKENMHTISRKPVSTASPLERASDRTWEDSGTSKPPLPPRRATGLQQNPTGVSDNGNLDLTLGQEKLGGGFDGEQAKLGKLIIEPEGQKMLDLVVATNLLAFRRAFAAADMLGRR